MRFMAPEAGAVEEFLAEYPTGEPVVMLNLLRFRERASYPAQHPADPCTGFEAFMRYSAGVIPLIAAIGGEVVWQGRQAAMLIGPQDKDWHLVVLVRYPGAGAFVDMIDSDDYRTVSVHRTAALEDSRLIAMREL